MSEGVFSNPENLTLTQLRVILAVVRSGGITQASEALGYLNASSVAYHIDRLEHRLGVTLFVRRGRGLVPTEMTQKICVTAEQVCSLVDQLHENLSLMSRGESERLRLGCSTMTLSFAKELNERLRELDVAVRVEIRQYWCSKDVREALAAQEIDLGLLCPGDELVADLPVVRLRERLMALVCESHRLYERKVIDVRELCAEAIILPDDGPDGDTLIEALGQKVSKVVRTVTKLPTLSSTVKEVQAGRGVAILPESTVVVNNLSNSARPITIGAKHAQRRVVMCLPPESFVYHPIIKRVVQLAQRKG